MTSQPNEDNTNAINAEVFDIMEVESSNEEVMSINKMNDIIVEGEDNNKIFKYTKIPNINSDELEMQMMTMIEKVGEGKASRWLCNICGNESGSKGHSKEHVEVHIEGLEYSCSGCNMVSKSSSSMRGHIRKHKANLIS